MYSPSTSVEIEMHKQRIATQRRRRERISLSFSKFSPYFLCVHAAAHRSLYRSFQKLWASKKLRPKSPKYKIPKAWLGLLDGTICSPKDFQLRADLCTEWNKIWKLIKSTVRGKHSINRNIYIHFYICIYIYIYNLIFSYIPYIYFRPYLYEHKIYVLVYAKEIRFFN